MVTDSRDRILSRIREALQTPAPKRHLHAPAGLATRTGNAAEAATQADWLPPVPASADEKIALFAKNSADLRTEFVACQNEADISTSLNALAVSAGWKRVASHCFPLGETAVNNLNLPVTWVEGGYAIPDLESADAGITGCECLVAQTGSILITTASSGGRALSVLPPHHVVIARRSQIVGDLSDSLAVVRKKNGGTAPSFLSYITGPSRTGDIERILVLGAHGPKRLTVLFLND